MKGGRRFSQPAGGAWLGARGCTAPGPWRPSCRPGVAPSPLGHAGRPGQGASPRSRGYSAEIRATAAATAAAGAWPGPEPPSQKGDRDSVGDQGHLQGPRAQRGPHPCAQVLQIAGRSPPLRSQPPSFSQGQRELPGPARQARGYWAPAVNRSRVGLGRSRTVWERKARMSREAWLTCFEAFWLMLAPLLWLAVGRKKVG